MPLCPYIRYLHPLYCLPPGGDAELARQRGSLTELARQRGSPPPGRVELYETVQRTVLAKSQVAGVAPSPLGRWGLPPGSGRTLSKYLRTFPAKICF